MDSGDAFIIIAGVIFIGIILLFIVLLPVAYTLHQGESTITIDSKVGAHGYGGDYIIFTTDQNGFEEAYTTNDNLLLWKWDASDRFMALKEGHTYRVKWLGYRIHILSEYKNIIELVEVVS